MGRRASWRQAELPFLERSRRLDRAFKLLIVIATSASLAVTIFGTPLGRRSAFLLAYTAKKSGVKLLGFLPDRADYEAKRDLDRQRGVEQTRGFLEDVGRKGGPTMQEFLRAAGMDHRSAVLGCGNVDWTLALSSDVFELDDAGRSYRLKPNTRSVWLINLTVEKVPAMFEIPDTPEARRLGQAVGGRVVPESVQSTNSWGCRGPEPDPAADLRVLVLGDSNMQGLLVGDDQTPPVRLEAALRDSRKGTVSVLNTGVLGYSPEQYYHTLLAFHDRFRPHCVIISLCANDFGDMRVSENWDEGEYWLDAIAQFCRTRNLHYLAVPLPLEDELVGRRNEDPYPARISTIFDGSGINYLSPVEAFADEHIRLRIEATREGRPFPNSPLYNRKYSDNHLSPLGCDLWSRIVARRIEQMMALDAAEGKSPR